MKYDALSLGFTISALALCLYYSTAEQSFIGLFPFVLISASVAINFIVKAPIMVDSSTSGGDIFTILFYAGIAFGGMVLSNLGVSMIQSGVTLSSYSAIGYGVMMAVAEENFFRGALINFAKRWAPNIGDFGAIAFSSACFYTYHFFIYGGNDSALLYVLASGMLLGFVATKTQRLSPGILAHVVNNVWAVMG